ncbi:helix-turn-helix transcriptional regulator [Alkalihalobacillus macyae]|uniref:helix-turn-helix transcriptional regulator n=1 Tax=Guptibacillus hwajinpoensis TaxID=208199 RepID=UPI00273CD61F|nr:helix-turn-helix transcriptional regulator [Alkalihalobacillus macyae]MDP4553554.1 helix-turn-helix transcriptional regulator [Alkalihalobacillus macyae]
MNTRIKELRAALKLTQAELAKRVNVRRETIVFLEKRGYNPSLKLAAKIARQLNSRIEDVFILDEDDLR